MRNRVHDHVSTPTNPFPRDFSERCRGAAAYVEALVGRFDAELILLHVIEATYNSTLEDLQETQREKFRKFSA